jgi:hypothetical protein
MFNRTLCATRRLALGCSFRSLVEDCSSAFENGAHFLGIDDPCLIQRLGFQTHQPSRHVVFDGEDQVDVQVVPHIRSTMLLGICSRSNPTDRFGKVRSYDAGASLAKAGEVSPGLTIILAGQVEIARLFAGHVAQGAGEPTFADAAWPGDDEVAAGADPFAGGELAKESTIEAAGGTIMIEAMACGTPVLAFRQGSVAEIIDQGVTGAIIDTMDEAMMILPASDCARSPRRSATVRTTIFLRAHGHGLRCGLPFAAQAAVHIGARDDCADATTGIGKKVEWTGS